jgi:hypothetical protein
MPWVVKAATAQNLGDVFRRVMMDLARTESNATFGLPAHTFDARPTGQRPSGKARITAWGVFQFNRPAWCALHGYAGSNCPVSLMPWRATPAEEIQKPINRYAAVFRSVKDAGASDHDAARGVRLWQRSPSVEFRKYLQRGRRTRNFATAWQAVEPSHRAAVDAHLRKPGLLPSQELDLESAFDVSDVVSNVSSRWRSGVESVLVRSAILKGATDENQLTNLIFFRRHRERNGRPLSRSEPDFQRLRQEWLTIRDRLVRPALARQSGSPQPYPSAPAPRPSPAPPPGISAAETTQCRSRTCDFAVPALTADLLRAEVVRMANEEYKRWGQGTLTETDPAIRPVLRDYWQTGVGIDPDRSLGGNWPSGVAWSAAFISWVVRTAGAGEAFCYSAAHGDYITWAKANREQNTCSPFRLFRKDEVSVQPGDILCRSRGAPGTYQTVQPGSGYHCDIVVAVGAGSTSVTTIGGNRSVTGGDPNLGLTVNRSRSSWPGSYFAVIRIADPPGSRSSKELETLFEDELDSESESWLSKVLSPYDPCPINRDDLSQIPALKAIGGTPWYETAKTWFKIGKGIASGQPLKVASAMFSAVKWIGQQLMRAADFGETMAGLAGASYAIVAHAFRVPVPQPPTYYSVAGKGAYIRMAGAIRKLLQQNPGTALFPGLEKMRDKTLAVGTVFRETAPTLQWPTK